MKVIFFKDNSCSLNYQHKDIYSQLSKDFEVTNKLEEADLIILAETCCCTEAHLMYTIALIDYIEKHKKENSKIFLTGCITRNFKNDNILGFSIEKFLKERVDYVIPQNNPNELLHKVSYEKYNYLDIHDFGSVHFNKHNQAEIFISNGCRNNCSFCKVTYQDYPLKSVDINEVKEAIDIIDEKKINTVFIKGTNVTQYGLDLYNDYKLPEIIEYIGKKDNIKSVKLVGFSFNEAIKNKMNNEIRESKNVDELCGSLESGSNRLLKLIRKGFTTEEIIDFTKDIRTKYDKQLYLNIITGFPTETKEDIITTLDVLKELSPYKIDLCRYTNSSCVDSNNYPQLTTEEIQDHTRIYEKVLKRRNIDIDIVGREFRKGKK